MKIIRNEADRLTSDSLPLDAQSVVLSAWSVRDCVGPDNRPLLSRNVDLDSKKLPGPE